MSFPTKPAVPALLLLSGLAVSGCGFSPPLSEGQRDAQQSCREDANRVYDAQNRAQLSERSSPDTPFSGATPRPLPGDGLSERFGFDQMVSTCLNRSEAVPVAADQH